MCEHKTLIFAGKNEENNIFFCESCKDYIAKEGKNGASDHQKN